jgi:sulfonate transport system ATP-binding protein
VLLSDRVVVLDGGTIVFDVPIDLPRPRRPGDPRVAARREQILDRVLGTGDEARSLRGVEPH